MNPKQPTNSSESYVFVVGETYGCVRAMQAAIQLGYRSASSLNIKMRTIFLGSYANLDTGALNLLQLLLQVNQKHPDWIFLRGSMEQMLLDLIDGVYEVEDEIERHGLRGQIKDLEALYSKWTRASPKTQNEIYDFLKNTQLYYETKHLIYCHGILHHTGQPLNEMDAESFVWRDTHDTPWQGKIYVHGAAHTNMPEIKQRGINLNTWLVGQQLTAVWIHQCNHDFKFFMINPQGKVENTFRISINPWGLD